MIMKKMELIATSSRMRLLKYDKPQQVSQVSRQVSLIPSISQRSSGSLSTNPHLAVIILPLSGFSNLNFNLESAHSSQVPHVSGHISDNVRTEQRSLSSTHPQS